MVDETQTQAENPNAASDTGAPAAASSTSESSGVQTAETGTVGNGEETSAPAAIAPITAAAPLTEEQHETLLKKVEELPEEIAAWVKKIIAEARAKI